jgi:hypothetical protein
MYRQGGYMHIEKATLEELYAKFRFDNLQYKVNVVSDFQLDVQVIEPAFRMILGHYLVEIDMHNTPLKDIYDQWKDKHVIYTFQRVDDNHADVEVKDLEGNLLKLYHIELRS